MTICLSSILYFVISMLFTWGYRASSTTETPSQTMISSVPDVSLNFQFEHSKWWQLCSLMSVLKSILPKQVLIIWKIFPVPDESEPSFLTLSKLSAANRCNKNNWYQHLKMKFHRKHFACQYSALLSWELLAEAWAKSDIAVKPRDVPRTPWKE